MAGNQHREIEPIGDREGGDEAEGGASGNSPTAISKSLIQRRHYKANCKTTHIGDDRAPTGPFSQYHDGQKADQRIERGHHTKAQQFAEKRPVAYTCTVGQGRLQMKYCAPTGSQPRYRSMKRKARKAEGKEMQNFLFKRRNPASVIGGASCLPGSRRRSIERTCVHGLHGQRIERIVFK